MTHNDLRYEFGTYQLNPSKRNLTRDGEGIPLTPKATEILLVLVKHAGQLVEKDELLKEVCPNTFVEEANLSQNIFTLRRALGDGRTGPKYIETIARRGYRFTRSVKTIDVNEFAESDGYAAKRPLVVLPFDNNTGDVELDYLADGAIDNTRGFLLLSVVMSKHAEQHLLRSKRLFDSLADSVHGAQTNETLLASISKLNSLRLQKKPWIAR